ncbi:MAG: heavy metal-binding domain-containing protein, partial [Thermoanaerobaculia bacterium]
MKHGDMKGMDMSGMKHGDMKGMDMSGMKHGDMKGMDMSNMKHGDMKGMDMSGMKHGDMKGMAGMDMSPVVPQPKALQAKAGETASTLRSDPLDAPATSSVTAAQQSSAMNQEMASGSGMSMSMGTYVQRDVGRPSSGASPMKGMDHNMPGMKMGGGGATHDMSGMNHGTGASAPKASTPTYVCSAHPQVVRDRPGTCPIDGTPLVKKEKQP